VKPRFLIAATLAAGLAASAGAAAQTAYPSKPLTWVVGFPPGGGADAVSRLVAGRLARNLGQSVVVENRPGASSIIAAQYVAQSAADGYTLFGAETGALVLNAALYSKLPYDPAQDFAPVCNMIRAPLVLVVYPGFPANDLKTLIEMAKKEPGKFNYASPGRGVAHHLAMETFKARAGIDIEDISYKGIGPAMQDVIAGQIPIAAVDTAVVLPQLRSGKLRALATFSSARLGVLPDVPSLAELGFPDMDIAPIVGVVVPRQTPANIVALLNAEVVRSLRDPEVEKKLTDLGLEVTASSPEQFAAFLEAQARRWLPFIREHNIRLD